MATVWSASSGYMFIGINLEWSGNPASGSVAVTATVKASSDGYGHNFSSRWSWWGYSGEGSEAFSFSSGYGATVYKQLAKWTFNVPLKYGATTRVGIGAKLGPIWNGGAPSVENYLTLPARPVQAPGAPSSVSATRVNDEQVSVAWVAPAVSAARPVVSYIVERRTDDAGAWALSASVPGSSTRFTNFVGAGHKYVYHVKAVNASGGSAYVSSGAVYTTPPAPINVTAVKDINGDIVVSWENKALYTPTRWDVYDGDTRVASVAAAAGATQWIHASPRLDVTHQYRVVCVAGDLESPKSAPSNIVQLLARPDAPSLLVDGTYFPADESVTLAWRHNATDASPQTRFSLHYVKRGSGEAPTVVDRRDSTQSLSLDLPAGEYEYWVSTWGLHAAESPESRHAVFYVEPRPLASVQAPGGEVRASSVEVRWSYATGGGALQARARVDLSLDGVIVESQEVSGPILRVPLATYLGDGLTYQVTVTVFSGHGLASWPVTQTFTVVYEKPPVPKAFLEWDDVAGCVRVRVDNPAPAAGKPAAVRNRVERSDDGGVTWRGLTDDLAVSGTLLDYESTSHGDVQYRVSAVSDLPSTASATASLSVESWAMWLGGGENFGVTVPLRWDPLHSCKTGLANRKLYRFAGRAGAVEMSGYHREKALSLSATLFDDDWELLQRIEQLSYLPAPFIYRDPMGRRVYCSLTSVDLDRALSGKWSVKLNVEEVDQ